MKKGFTMIELVFVIVILGILVGIAVPRLSDVRGKAEEAKVKSQIAAIRSWIQTERGKNILKGTGSSYPSTLESGECCFGAVLGTPASGWTRSDNTYTVTYDGNTATFTYDPTKGTFSCNGCALD